MITTIILDWGRTCYDNENGWLFSETRDILEKLAKKYRLALVSLVLNGDTEARKKVMRDEDLERFFEHITFVGADKDAAYEETLRVLQVRPEEVVMVDDRVIRGIKWGNKRGATTIWVERGKFAAERPDASTGEPAHIVKNLGELESILLP